jgi:phage repressor protein C with HTH and peptisase S24 domain
MQIKKNIMKSKTGISLKLLGKNVTYLMRKTGIDSQNLSKATGVGIATINNLKKGSGNPTISTLSSIAEFFNVTPGEIMDTDLSKPVSNIENFRSLPLTNLTDLSAYLSGNLLPNSTYTTEIDDENDEIFALEINTNALLPEIEKGSICIVSIGEKYCDGDIVLLKVRNKHLCFRRIFISNDGCKFSNIALEPNTTLSSYDNYEIVGVMIKKINYLK